MTTPMTRFQAILSKVLYPGMVLEVSFDGWQSPPSEEPNYFLRWTEPHATCNTAAREAALTGKPDPGQPYDSKGRKWRLSQHMTDGEVVGTAFKALLTYQEHETRERFTFDGVPVYDSHVDIHRLVALRKEPEAVVGRKTPCVVHYFVSGKCLECGCLQ